MVKLFAIEIFYKGAKVQELKSAHELQSFGYFQRSSVKEFMDFTGRIIVERTTKNQRASVKEKDYMCHVYVNQDGLSAVAISDTDYPNRVAFNMLNKLLEEFSSQVSMSQYTTADPSTYTFTLCETFLEKYQNPSEADPMMRVQTELDETKIIVYNTIEQVLQRGEKLDDLVAKSDNLSMSSRTFYKTAKKTNSCCSW
ncbi:synaptobrevin homolog YKT6-like [Hydractinia symbiolongicarpus]|uniref:synaptobrevin homolog YKT6-like n=1 Tax=Hydractinia symbiolongicarpus TaxID=13093 RepID=UPI0025505176|nr:synaptobrevin homolog YKT6-like [Hydractinia symbiolongicarpus]